MIARTPPSSRPDHAPGSTTSGRPLGDTLTRLARRAAIAPVLALGLTLAGQAFAANNDAEATKLYDAAMNEDYLNVELAKAETKLKDAIKKCSNNGCSAAVTAKVQIGLGVIHFANNKPDLAKEAFIAGLKADGTATLDATFKGAEIDKIFDEAKKAAGGGSGSGGSAGAGGSAGTGGDGGGGPSKPGGDLKHTPVSEQQVNTPVPIYIEVPADLGVKKVTLRYKPFGSSTWKPLDMAKVGDGWGIEVPCAEVTTTGDLKYYITADDDAGTVATAGSRNEPYKVSVKNEIESDPPALPGKKPPKQCASGTDCPPGFPRCVDSACASNDDCNTGLECKKSDDGEGTCKRKSSEGKPWGSSCSEASECGDGLTCTEGSCQEGTKDPGSTPSSGNKKLNMVSIEGMMDLLLIGSRELVCSGTKDGAALKNDGSNASDGSYVCFYKDGDTKRTGQFYGEPDNTATGTNGITGGFGVAGGRIGVGYDRQLTQNLNFTLGVHLGVAFSDFPSSPNPPTGDQPGLGHSQANSFLPFWVEGRVGYNLFGGWVEPRKFKPYGYVGFGYGQVNAGVPVSICDKRDAEGDKLPSNTSTNNCPSGSEYQEVTAYQITGLDYIPIGVGTTFGLWKGLGVKAELRVLFMLPTFGVVFQPSIGPVYAF